jgi:hypothetical protein
LFDNATKLSIEELAQQDNPYPKWFGLRKALTAPNLLLKAETYPRRQRVV